MIILAYLFIGSIAITGMAGLQPVAVSGCDDIESLFENRPMPVGDVSDGDIVCSKMTIRY